MKLQDSINIYLSASDAGVDDLKQNMAGKITEKVTSYINTVQCIYQKYGFNFSFPSDKNEVDFDELADDSKRGYIGTLDYNGFRIAEIDNFDPKAFEIEFREEKITNAVRRLGEKQEELAEAERELRRLQNINVN